jgi:hypothetical protein
LSAELEAQPEADNLSANIFHPKAIYRVGCWNMWIFYQTGKLAQVHVLMEMDQHYNELLGVSETRWTDGGSMQITSGHNIFYSGL